MEADPVLPRLGLRLWIPSVTRRPAFLAAIALLLLAPVARADGPVEGPAPAPPAPLPPSPPTPAPAPTSASPADAAAADAHISAAHDAYIRHDYLRAREELLAAYGLDPRPALLFALGQAEFNLGHYREAIDYYQRFTATNPSPDQAALAQQAIGAARIKLATPPPPPPPPATTAPPPPPPPPPHRDWDRLDSALAISGGAAALLGGGLIVTGVALSHDASGTLHSYDRRLHDASLARVAGISAIAAGALAATGALLRWRFHLVTTVGVEASPTRVGISLEHPL